MHRLDSKHDDKIVDWLSRFGLARYAQSRKLDFLATSMRDFDDVTPHMQNLYSGQLPDHSDPSQRLSDLSAAKLAVRLPAGLSDLGQNVLANWQKFEVGTTDIQDELGRHLVLHIEAQRLDEPAYKEIREYWGDLRDSFDPKALIKHWDKLYQLNYLDYDIEGFAPGRLIRNLGVDFKDIDFSPLTFLENRNISDTGIMAGASRLQRAAEGLVPRGRHRATSALALELMHFVHANEVPALLKEFGVPKRLGQWAPFSEKTIDKVIKIYSEYISSAIKVATSKSALSAEKSTSETKNIEKENPKDEEQQGGNTDSSPTDEDIILNLPDDFDFAAAVESPPNPEPAKSDKGNSIAGGGAKKQDYEKKTKQNKKLGDAGEEFVLLFEKNRLKHLPELAKKITRVSIDDDTLGYDISSFEESGEERFIEVKTTRGAKSTPFFMSAPERKKAESLDGRYFVYRVFNIALDPKLVVVQSPLDEAFDFEIENYRVTFK